MNLNAPSWLVTWLQSVNLWDAILVLVGVVAFIWFIKRKGWRTVKAIAKGIINAAEILEAVQGLPGFIDRTDRTLQAHTRQIENSHDTNMRDDITAAVDLAREARDLSEGLHGRLDDVDRQLTTLATADDAIRREFEQTNPPKEQP